MKHDVLRRLLVGVALALVVSSAAAQAPTAPSTPAAPPEPSGPELPLTLGEALRIALENNLDLVVARKNPAISEQGVIIAETAFDSSVEAHGRYNPQDLDSTYTGPDALPNTTSSTDLWAVGGSWGQKVSFGADYRLSYDYTNTNPGPTLSVSENNITNASDNYFTNNVLEFQYHMPLLKGFGREVNTADIVVARNDLQISHDALTVVAQDTLIQVEAAYWNLLALKAAVRVANESLNLANDLLTLNQKKVDVGTLAPIEIVQAQSGVAGREEGVIVAQQNVGNAEDHLRSLLAFPKDDPRWNAAIVPTDKPTLEERSVDFNRSLELALQNRPEFEQGRLDLQSSQLRERVARKNVRHSLNLDLAAIKSDNSSQFRSISTFGTETQTNNFDLSDKGFDWSVALVYGYPIGNREAKANYAISELVRQQSEARLANTEQGIRVDVRTAVRAVESGIKRMQAAQAATVLQRKTLEAEQKKFENGMSTSFEVLRIQTDLTTAQSAEISAILDYNIALAQLEQVQGTLLGARGLVLETPQGGTK